MSDPRARGGLLDALERAGQLGTDEVESLVRVGDRFGAVAAALRGAANAQVAQR